MPLLTVREPSPVVYDAWKETARNLGMDLSKLTRDLLNRAVFRLADDLGLEADPDFTACRQHDPDSPQCLWPQHCEKDDCCWLQVRQDNIAEFQQRRLKARIVEYEKAGLDSSRLVAQLA